MKEHPIIFNTPMVQAILDGRKTQTRRVVKPQPKPHQSGGWVWEKVGGVIATASGKIYKSKMLIRNPYGKPSDRLWVRETFTIIDDREFGGDLYPEYKADNPNAKYPGEWPEDEAKGNPEAPKWKPSIHMPKKYARIWLEITGVRVERLKGLTPEDGIAEGVEHWSIFPSLWDSINGKKHPWKSNPWVWVVEFTKSLPPSTKNGFAVDENEGKSGS